MPVIDSEVFIAAPPRLAFDLACDHDRYQEYGVRDLISVRTVEPDEGDGRQVTDWVWNLKGARIRYRERDIHDAERLHIHVEQIQGDLKRYVTDWHFLPAAGGTRFTSRVEFDMGIPMLSGLLDPVARLVIRRTVDALVNAIKSRAESQGAGD